MRKINKITDTIVILSLIGMFLYPNLSFAGTGSLRVPTSFEGNNPDFNSKIQIAYSSLVADNRSSIKVLSLQRVTINPWNDLIFEDEVREMCKTCKRYGTNAMCPPFVDSVEHYREVFTSYKYGEIYAMLFEIDDPNNWMKLGIASTLKMQSLLIQARNELIKQGYYDIVLLGAGSCKRCSICTVPCRNPEKSLISLEGAGINVVKMMKRFGIEIKFPVEETFYRIGGVFYNDKAQLPIQNRLIQSCM